MAEVWYLTITDNSLEGKEPVYKIEFEKCIQLLELKSSSWKSELDVIPQLKTGDPLVDESARVFVVVKLLQEEIETIPDKSWKSGWYISPLTIINVENKIREESSSNKQV